MTTEDVLMEYRKRLSIRETARALDVSEGVVRKCLITHGEIETAMTRRIGALLQEGRSQKEICGMLGISSSCVNANSPYERGVQIEPSQTVFQSTHPSRGATLLEKGLEHGPAISIHAPLTGCDGKNCRFEQQFLRLGSREAGSVRPSANQTGTAQKFIFCVPSAVRGGREFPNRFPFARFRSLSPSAGH